MTRAGTLGVFCLLPTLCFASEPSLSLEACQLLTAHSPAPSVAYREGADVSGKPVVPADLSNDYDGIVPKELRIPLSVDLLGFLDIDPASFPYKHMGETQIPTGILTLNDGRVTLDGHDLSRLQENRLRSLCGTNPD